MGVGFERKAKDICPHVESLTRFVLLHTPHVFDFLNLFLKAPGVLDFPRVVSLVFSRLFFSLVFFSFVVLASFLAVFF